MTIRSFRLVVVYFSVLFAISVASVMSANATPQFARETKMPCGACHSYVPRLNEMGQRYYNNGFRLQGMKKEPTHPFWAQLAATGVTPSDGNRLTIKWSDTALASGGSIDGLNLLYRLMWRPISHDIELYGIYQISENLVLSAGKIPMISQFDPELELSSISPVALAPAASGGETPFAPTGTALALRIVGSTQSAMPYGDGWKLTATVPFSNERGDNAGAGRLDDFETSPKGLFLEAYRRQGVNSFGVNAFFGRDGRRYQGLVLQREFGSLYFEGSAGYSVTSDGSTNAYSLGFDWIPRPDRAMGLRVDSQAGRTSFVPFASFLLGGNETALRFFVESRLQDGSRPVTTLALKFRF